ncbi:MAG: ornithine carbamoyltransferase [Vicinamibacteria bacterium]|jgi:ornithine carbamoyltransferase|nr:ornithine carbamoyltransferase [Vicinamibacteria bacterium]
MMLKHLLTLEDVTGEWLLNILAQARRMKAAPLAERDALRGQTLALLFEKHSTRTRVSFEVGMFQLGGHTLFMGRDDMQIKRGESIADTARVLSRYVNGIAARVFSHQDLVELRTHATVPVINALSDRAHPCQAAADYLTLSERFGSLAGLTMAYVGDGNNVCHDLISGAVRLGVALRVAAPKGYEPLPEIVAAAAKLASEAGRPAPQIVNDPKQAVSGAHAIYTDVWTSMGQEDEQAARLSAFRGFTVTRELMDLARPDAIFLHCLPAHRGEEVAADVIDSPRSAVLDQAENRLHVQKAILLDLLRAD